MIMSQAFFRDRSPETIIVLGCLLAHLLVRMICMVRMHRRCRRNLIVPRKMSTPCRIWHDKRADEQQKGEAGEHRG
ncbi:hypothetical protein EH30_03450 [Erythrobacter sp. JL475]|nr:hypothetical protein EH30_03450 [Erythrobacter sp. JL475]